MAVARYCERTGAPGRLAGPSGAAWETLFCGIIADDKTAPSSRSGITIRGGGVVSRSRSKITAGFYRPFH